jgi:hypothetical protein
MSKEHRVEELQEFKNILIHISGVFNEFKDLKAKVDAISEELSELRSFTKDVMVTLRELTRSFIQEERTKSQKLTNLEAEVKSLRIETFNATEKSRIYLENHITCQSSQGRERTTRRQTQKRLTGQQILDELKNSITDVTGIDDTPNAITDLKQARDVIKKIEYN